MRIASSGFVFDARQAPATQRSCAFTAVTLLKSGELLVSFRRGSQRESADGHACLFASVDGGQTWEPRFDGSGDGAWEGTPGEVKSLLVAELEPGLLWGSELWVERSGAPRPFVHPRTQGLLPTRVGHCLSRDGGRTWEPRRAMTTQPHPGTSPTGPLLCLADGSLAQPYESWKEYEDPAPARPVAALRLSRDSGENWPEYAVVAAHPQNSLYYWDQRIATHPHTRELVAMFWTHDPASGSDRDIHLARSSPDGRRWTQPTATGLPGQHCQPIPLGGDRLLAVYAQRGNPPGIRATLSEDFGSTWRGGELEVYRSEAGEEAGARGERAQGDYWDDMVAWRFGHPRGVLLPGGEVFVTFYAGDDRSTGVRWARIALQARRNARR